MLWIIIWLLSMVAFLLLPVCCVEKRRKLWLRRLFTCRWEVGTNEGSDRGNRTSSRTPSTPDYVLSKAQEDSIRASFLTERLRMFTITLNSDMISKADNDINGDESKAEAKDFHRVSTDQTGGESSGSEEATDNSSETSNADSSDENEDVKSDDIESADSSVEEVLADGGGGSVSGLPYAGECRRDMVSDTPPQPDNNEAGSTQTRCVTNGCPICLSSFAAGERLSWSSNPACEHVFHHTCIVDWLQASGQKYLKKIRRNELRRQELEMTIPDDPIERVTAFPMLCPCCRQCFVLQTSNEEEESDQLEKGNRDEGGGTSPANNNNTTTVEPVPSGEEAV